MSTDASLEELETRLVTFTEQLQNIHELLQSDPTNAEFLSIATDLVEVIQLTKETIDLKVNFTLADKVSELPKPQEQSQELSALVEALQQGVWYPAHVDSVTSDGNYNVKFLGFGTAAELSENALRSIEVDPEEAAKLPAKEAISEGFKCRAKYYADAVVYPCSVTKVTELGFQVLFDGYGNSEEVPYEYLRPVVSSPQPEVGTIAHTSTTNAVDGDVTHTATATAPIVAPAVIHKPIKIPENLQILPTDTEAEKERKRKR
ncbi:RNA binding protein, partial [Phytophthora palmivora]